MARLNLGGGGTNVHLGVTGGFIGTSGKELTGTGSTNFDVPFVGVYAAMSSGGFFADILARWDFYDMEATQPQLNTFNSPFDGRAFSLSGAAGYQFNYGMWFFEPSGGLIWSRFQVDPFFVTGAAGVTTAGFIHTEDIDSLLGRVGVRVGTVVTSGNLIIQPFVAASVWHEFADDAVSSFDGPGNQFRLVTSRVGTYGQYGLGFSAQVANTGWTGYVRGDYRNGDRIEGWSVNGGIRYNFASAERPLAVKY